MQKRAWLGIGLAIAIVVVVAVVWQATHREAPVMKIGAVLPLTGEAAQWGIPPKQGAELAVAEINAAGGVSGRALKLYVQDSACDARTAVSAFQNLLATNSDVQVVIGAVCSSATLAIAPIAERRHIVLISPASTSPDISQAGDFIFRNIPTDALRGRVFAEYVFSQANISRVAILYVNNDAGVGNKDAFTARFTEIGGEMLGAEAYPEGTRDVRSQLTKAKALNPEALMVVSYPDDTIVVIKQARELVPELPLFFQAEAVEDPSVKEALGAALDGVTYILPAKPKGATPDRFAEAYRKRYGNEPELFAAEGYDCVQLIADAFREAEGQATATAIRDHLYSVRDHAGASGRTTFDRQGDVLKPMAVKQMKDGEPVVVLESS